MNGTGETPVVRDRNHGRDARATSFIILVELVEILILLFFILFFTQVRFPFVGILFLALLIVVGFFLFVLFFFLILFFILGFFLGVLGARLVGRPGGPMGGKFGRDERCDAKRRKRLTHGFALCDHGNSNKRGLTILGLSPVHRAYQNPKFFHVSTANSSPGPAESG